MITLTRNGAKMLINERGAEARAYADENGAERLWSGDPAVWSGVSPLLFPSIGFLKNGKITFNGRELHIPKHGFARGMDFTPDEVTDSAAVLSLRASDETREVYPFDFALLVTHELIERGFETRFEVTNEGGGLMPFVIGGHPAFLCPSDGVGGFEECTLRFERAEKPETLLCTPEHLMGGSEHVDLGEDGRTLRLRHADFDRLDTYVFAGVKSRSVELVSSRTGSGIRVSYWGFEALALWTMPNADAPYLCIEPWHGLPALEDESGRFEDKPFHVELARGGAYRCGYRMEII